MARPRVVRTPAAKAPEAVVEEEVKDETEEETVAEEAPEEAPVENPVDTVDNAPEDASFDGGEQAYDASIPTVPITEDTELDERFSGPPKGIVLTEKGAALPLDENGIVQEDVYRKVLPLNSRRPTYVLVARKGSRIIT